MSTSRTTLAHLVRSELPKCAGNLAFVLGNGINRHAKIGYAWTDMISSLVMKYEELQPGEIDLRSHLDSISHTQIFDLLQLTAKADNEEQFYALKKEVASELLKGEVATDIHRQFVNAMRALNCPLLTTNFDLEFEESSPEVKKFMWGNSKRPHKPHRHANAKLRYWHWLYPWSSYASDRELVGDVRGQFGIWHMHGNVAYPGSIRLGLDDYFGMMKKAKGWTRRLKDSPFRTALENPESNACYSWLNIFMHNNLVVLGLGLPDHEIFVRWLLLKRFEHYKTFSSDPRPNVWYVDLKEGKRSEAWVKGRNAFFRHIGVEVVQAISYKQMYETLPKYHLPTLARKMHRSPNR